MKKVATFTTSLLNNVKKFNNIFVAKFLDKIKIKQQFLVDDILALMTKFIYSTHPKIIFSICIQ